MELKEFIKATITTIAEAIEELNDELSDKVVVNPHNARMLDKDSQTDKLVCILEGKNNERLIQYIEFNLTISDVSERTSGGGLVISVFKADVNGKKGTENNNTVKFSIPVAFLK